MIVYDSELSIVSHEKWWFSLAMLHHQRVKSINIPQTHHFPMVFLYSYDYSVIWRRVVDPQTQGWIGLACQNPMAVWEQPASTVPGCSVSFGAAAHGRTCQQKQLPGWWYTYPSEIYKFVNWDDDIPNWMGKWKMFQTTNQLLMTQIIENESCVPHSPLMIKRTCCSHLPQSWSYHEFLTLQRVSDNLFWPLRHYMNSDEP